MIYKTKPKEVKAFKLGMQDIPYWFLSKISQKKVELKPFIDHRSVYPNKVNATVHNNHGILTANHGDYIILYSDDLYVMTAKKFEHETRHSL